MKLLRVLFCLVFPFFFLLGCGGSSPLDQPVKQFYAAVANGNIDDAVGMFDMTGSFSQTDLETRGKIVTMLVKEMNKKMNQHSGLKKVKILDRNMTDDGKRAQLSAVMNFNDGTVMHDRLTLVQVGQDWKIQLQ